MRVLEKRRGAAVWRLVPPGPKLRPLPKSLVGSRGKIGDLFPGIEAWAQARNVLTCVDREALTAEEMHWTANDLDSLFALLSPKAFQSGPLAPLLASFLGSITPDEADRRAIGPHVVAALRKAMVEPVALAPSGHVSDVLRHVPQAALLPLPPTVEHRQLLRALASAAATILSVRGEWIGGASPVTTVSKADSKGLLGALEPYIDGNIADQAATATLALLVRSGQDILQEVALDCAATAASAAQEGCRQVDGRVDRRPGHRHRIDRSQQALAEWDGGELQGQAPRDECLSLEWFRSRAEAKAVIESWRGHYNEAPHSSLGYLTPAAFAASIRSQDAAPRVRRGGALRCVGPPRPAPSLHRPRGAIQGSNRVVVVSS